MKITNKTLNKNIDQVECGELFIVDKGDEDYNFYDEKILMKIMNNKKDDTRNAVDVRDGRIYCINNNKILHIINGELTI